MTDDSSPGWDAIERAVSRLYPGHEPLHWASNTLPGQDGAYGISAYRDGWGWFLVTYGLSELFAKTGSDPNVSGWGFELTMRVAASGQDGTPTWAVRLLTKLGRYVYEQSRPFADGHRMSPGGPITGSPDTALTALAFTADPRLTDIDTPNGQVRFLTVVGLLPAELARMQASSTAEVLDTLRVTSPDLVTDLNRS